MTATNDDLATARLLLNCLGVDPAGLLGQEPADTRVPDLRPMPTIGQWIPVVTKLVSPSTARSYGSYWNKAGATGGWIPSPPPNSKQKPNKPELPRSCVATPAAAATLPRTSLPLCVVSTNTSSTTVMSTSATTRQPASPNRAAMPAPGGRFPATGSASSTTSSPAPATTPSWTPSDPRAPRRNCVPARSPCAPATSIAPSARSSRAVPAREPVPPAWAAGRRCRTGCTFPQRPPSRWQSPSSLDAGGEQRECRVLDRRQHLGEERRTRGVDDLVLGAKRLSAGRAGPLRYGRAARGLARPGIRLGFRRFSIALRT